MEPRWLVREGSLNSSIGTVQTTNSPQSIKSHTPSRSNAPANDSTFSPHRYAASTYKIPRMPHYPVDDWYPTRVPLLKPRAPLAARRGARGCSTARVAEGKRKVATTSPRTRCGSYHSPSPLVASSVPLSPSPLIIGGAIGRGASRAMRLLRAMTLSTDSKTPCAVRRPTGSFCCRIARTEVCTRARP